MKNDEEGGEWWKEKGYKKFESNKHLLKTLNREMYMLFHALRL